MGRKQGRPHKALNHRPIATDPLLREFDEESWQEVKRRARRKKRLARQAAK